MVVDLQI